MPMHWFGMLQRQQYRITCGGSYTTGVILSLLARRCMGSRQRLSGAANAPAASSAGRSRVVVAAAAHASTPRPHCTN